MRRKKETFCRITVAFTVRQRDFLELEAQSKYEGKMSQMFREIVNFYELHHPQVFEEKC